jgi:uncharacterized protein (TIGR02453 family)
MKETVITFLRDLEKNNNREWFQANKRRYEESKADFENFIDALIPEIARFDPSITFVEAKECIFRIFRDVRFAKNKDPYKTNFGAWIAKGGRKSPGPGYYFHVEPSMIFVAGGIHMPEPELLKKIRQEIYYNIDEFKKILSEKEFAKNFSGIDDYEKMKKAPKDFPADFKDIDLLKYKSYTVSHTIDVKSITSDTLPVTVVKVCKTLKPYNDFMRRATEA